MCTRRARYERQSYHIQLNGAQACSRCSGLLRQEWHARGFFFTLLTWPHKNLEARQMPHSTGPMRLAVRNPYGSLGVTGSEARPEVMEDGCYRAIRKMLIFFRTLLLSKTPYRKGPVTILSLTIRTSNAACTMWSRSRNRLDMFDLEGVQC